MYPVQRDAVVSVLMALSAQNERLEAQVAKLTTRVARQDERIATVGSLVEELFAAAERRPSGHGAAAREGPLSRCAEALRCGDRD